MTDINNTPELNEEEYEDVVVMTDEDGAEEEEELFFLKAEKTEEGEVYTSIEDEQLLNAVADAYEKEFIQRMKEHGAAMPEPEKE